PLIIADSSQLQQVFINIILNAVDAMRETGTLTLKTFQDDLRNSVYVSISDTGPGIEDADKTKLFEPFFTTKNVGQGTGLGLSISYSIIQKHHGTIDVQSRIGEGSTFTVKLPVKREIEND
ncbi:MAG: ATP-binding protein, partial [Candidatus Aminicenantes bacterium]|nr:ATP-binding protein [Candidatus Aminicenantes bacterium]